MSIKADAGDPAAFREAVRQTVQAFGRIDILVNNAGIALNAPSMRWSSLVLNECPRST